MVQKFLKRAAAVAVVSVVAVAALQAIEQRPMPAFEVINAAGEATPSIMMGPGGKWLLIYVTPECRSCRKLFTRWRSGTRRR